MIRRAPTARWFIIVLLVIVTASFAVMYVVQRGRSILAKPLPEQRVAFISNRGGNTDLWTMKLDGSDMINITHDAADDRAPVWSPNGSDIVSISDRVSGKYQIVITSWNGNSTQVLTISDGTKDVPSFTKDGNRIIYVSSGNVFVRDRFGGDEEQLLPVGDIAKQQLTASMPFAYAAYSPANNYIMGVRDTDTGRVCILLEANGNTVGDDTKPLVATTAHEIDAVWSPVGAKYAIAYVDDHGLNGLAVFDVEKKMPLDLFRGNGIGPAKPSWSPVEDKIAYEAWSVKDGYLDKNLGIYVINASPDKPYNPQKLVGGDAREPSWSADGKYIFFSKPRPDGKRDIWRINADGSGALNLTNGKGDNYNPVCSPLPHHK